jgi:hypothetical protein
MTDTAAILAYVASVAAAIYISFKAYIRPWYRKDLAAKARNAEYYQPILTYGMVGLFIFISLFPFINLAIGTVFLIELLDKPVVPKDEK